MRIRIFDVNHVVFAIKEVSISIDCPACRCEVVGEGFVVLFVFNDAHQSFLEDVIACPDCGERFQAPFLFVSPSSAKGEADRFDHLLYSFQRDKEHCLLPIDNVFPLLVFETTTSFVPSISRRSHDS